MLKIESIKKEYENFNLDCSLNVKNGEIVGLVGANGAGKSTTFKAILRLIKIDDGKIELLNSTKLTEDIKQQIGIVLCDSTFQRFFTIETISQMLIYSYKNFNKDLFLESCKEFNLPLNKTLKEFSTGMLAKLKVLISMSYDAKFLILDEPTSGMDTVVRNELLDKIREYVDSDNTRSVLMSSHIGSDLKKICDRLYFMKDGKIIYEVNTNKLLNEHEIIDTKEPIVNNNILFTMKKKDGYYAHIIRKENDFKKYVRNLTDIDDMIEIIMKGKKYG